MLVLVGNVLRRDRCAFTTANRPAGRRAIQPDRPASRSGGVVPELASRDHVKRMPPLIRQVLEEAGREAGQIDAVAYTAGPDWLVRCRWAPAPRRWRWPGAYWLSAHHMEGRSADARSAAAAISVRRLLVSVAIRSLFAWMALADTSCLRIGGRCRWRGLRQDGKADGFALSRRAGIARLAEQGAPGRFVLSAADD